MAPDKQRKKADVVDEIAAEKPARFLCEPVEPFESEALHDQRCAADVAGFKVDCCAYSHP